MSETQLADLDSPSDHSRESMAFKESVLRAAVAEGLLNDEQPVAGFVDVEGVSRTIQSLVSAFSDNFKHTFAAKANSMSHALGVIRDHGLGCEVASPGELRQALRAGFEPADIVYDEPAKTPASLQFALRQGINFNIDNFQEFDRVIALVRETEVTARVGFRINPQVGSGSIGPMSTATSTSKFGVTLDDPGNRQRLIGGYKEHAWLTSMHTHIGSQGCSMDLMVSGIRKVVDFALDVNKQIGHQQIEVIDIGGGLPVNFESEDVSPSFLEYADKLRHSVPELFDGAFTVKTEFGRSIYAKNGFIAARVEYTKEAGGRHIAITHAGAQTATRTALMPDLWKIRLSVFDALGNERTGPDLKQDVAGPCCFAGDMLAHNRLLPAIQQNDIVLLHDTGAYYFSNPFFYNNLPPIAVYGAVASDDEKVAFSTWREQQSIDDLLAVVG